MNSVTVEYVRFSVGLKYNNQEYQTYLTNQQIYKQVQVYNIHILYVYIYIYTHIYTYYILKQI